MPNCKFSQERLVIGSEDQNATETAAVIRAEFEQKTARKFAELDSLSDDQAEQLLGQLKSTYQRI